MKLIWEIGYEIDSEELECKIMKFEDLYRIKLPKLYKEVLRKKRERCLACEIMIKNFNSSSVRDEIYWNILDGGVTDLFIVNDRNKDVRPNNINFFAYTSGGNYYGFDFKDSPNDPKIVYYNHELVPPKEDLIADGFVGDEVEEEQRKYYKTVYDNFEDLYNHLELGQKYWIEEEFGSEDSEELKDFLASDWTY